MFRRPRRDPLITTATVLFAAGLVALAVAFALFAEGHRDLPAWLSLAIVLLPIGLALGTAGTLRQHRRRAATPAEPPTPAAAATAPPDPDTRVESSADSDRSSDAAGAENNA